MTAPQTTEAILREQVRMWKRMAHIFGVALIMTAIAMGALGISNLLSH